MPLPPHHLPSYLSVPMLVRRFWENFILHILHARGEGTRTDVTWELLVSPPSVIASSPDLVMGTKYIKSGLKGLCQSRGSLQALVSYKAVLEGMTFFQNSLFQIILLPLRVK